MAIEQLMKAILAAGPVERRKIEAVLSGKEKTQKQGVARETRLVTISGAAKLLALGRNTIYRLIHEKRLDVVKIGTHHRVTLRSIHTFLDESTHEEVGHGC